MCSGVRQTFKGHAANPPWEKNLSEEKLSEESPNSLLILIHNCSCKYVSTYEPLVTRGGLGVPIGAENIGHASGRCV